MEPAAPCEKAIDCLLSNLLEGYVFRYPVENNSNLILDVRLKTYPPASSGINRKKLSNTF
jgi:hypothetical protein